MLDKNISRRFFLLKTLAKLFCSFFVVSYYLLAKKKLIKVSSPKAFKKCASFNLIDEKKDSQAISLRYKHDSDDKEIKKIKKYKMQTIPSLQKCSNCSFYKSENNKQISCENKLWAPCSILKNQYVSANGWCIVWSKKKSLT